MDAVDLVSDNMPGSASDYTPASWQALTSALTAARGVLTNADATQAEVDTAAANLTTARTALVAGSSGSDSNNSSNNHEASGRRTGVIKISPNTNTAHKFQSQTRNIQDEKHLCGNTCRS
jgi:hypothetical protein